MSEIHLNRSKYDGLAGGQLCRLAWYEDRQLDLCWPFHCDRRYHLCGAFRAALLLQSSSEPVGTAYSPSNRSGLRSEHLCSLYSVHLVDMRLGTIGW